MPATFVASSKLPTAFGEFAMHGFEDSDSGQEHIALVFGDLTKKYPNALQSPLGVFNGGRSV